MTVLQSPAAAELLLDFVNTRDLAGSGERLGSGAGFGGWLTDNGHLDAGAPVSDMDATAARELRAALVEVFLAHAGSPADDQAELRLRRFGELHPVLPVLTAEGCRLVPAQQGVPGFFARILAAAAELAMTGRWQRLKACQNPPCHQGFYDRTRNGAGAYCSARTCGSQVAMRAYRARRAQTT